MLSIPVLIFIPLDITPSWTYNETTRNGQMDIMEV